MTKAFWIRYLQKGGKDRQIGTGSKCSGMPKMAISNVNLKSIKRLISFYKSWFNLCLKFLYFTKTEFDLKFCGET